MAPQVARETPWVSADRTPASAYAGLGCPVLLVDTDGTRAPMRRVVRRLERAIPGMARATLSGAGHMAPVAAPDRLAPILRDWLDGATPRAS